MNKDIEKLYESVRTAVYRTHDSATNTSLIVKILNVDHPTPETIARFKYEYEILKNVDSPGIVKVLGFEPFMGKPAIFQEDFGGSSLAEQWGSPSARLDETLPLLIGMARALGEIHAASIIHKDINLTNILFNRQSRQVKIIDFGIASKLLHENLTILGSRVLEGTLAYMSPEQTGRMNRSLDYRSDYYSLGIVFYQLLTGLLPFQTLDTLELIHCHIAQQAVPVCKVRPAVAVFVSDIVEKLMAKNAEDRYQSIYGLLSDLEQAHAQLSQCGMIENRAVAANDFSDKFNIPNKLYGREKEVAILLDSFATVAAGGAEIITVAGYSGIGKSSLVLEIHKPIVRNKGFFISGKFDQFRRNTPYSALIQAFQELCRQLLTQPEKQLAGWKADLLESLGGHAKVVVDVIPELEIIIGAQAPVAALGPTESQNRFNHLFEKFVKVFATRDHPLVLFLDDLQWADSATLNFVEKIILEGDIKFLLIIGSYRDNEVSDSHPFVISLDKIKRTRRVTAISLQALAETDIGHLVADTLGLERPAIQDLAALISQKTGGNPFFINTFFSTLYHDRLLRFDHAVRRWVWDVQDIRARDITNNVLELMISKLKKLPAHTQQALMLASCIGNSFDLGTLAAIYEKTPVQTAIDLWPAVIEGVIIPGEEHKILNEMSAQVGSESAFVAIAVTDRFVHDHLQKAAYELIDEGQQKAVHLKIGRLLLAKTPEHQMDELLFYITEQLNHARDLMGDAAEKCHLAELNLRAGKKAKDSTAYGPACDLLNIGISLFDDACWQSHYPLAFELHKECAESAYLCGNFEQAETLFNLLLRQCHSMTDRSRVFKIMMLYYNNINKFKDNIRLGLQALKEWGIALPDQDCAEDINASYAEELEKYQASLRCHDAADFIDLPRLNDERIEICLDLLVTMVDAAYLGNPAILGLVILKQVNLSIACGNSPLSPCGYVWWGVFLIGNNHVNAYKFGKLALQLSEQHSNTFISCRTNHMFGGFIQLWKESLSNCIQSLKKAFQFGIDSGDLNYSNYAATIFNRYAFYQGQILTDVADEAQTCLHFMAKTKHLGMFDLHTLIYYANLSIQGKTLHPLLVNKNEQLEYQKLKEWQGSGMNLQISLYAIMKMMLSWLSEDYRGVLRFAEMADQHKSGISPQFDIVQIPFYQTLAMAALYPECDAAEQTRLGQVMTDNIATLAIWSELASENCSNKYELLLAEQARISQDTALAMKHYERSISAANLNGFHHENAIANELYGRFWMALGNQKIARLYLQESVCLFDHWGAGPKLSLLVKQFSGLISQKSSSITQGDLPGTTTLSTDESLDLSSIKKASNAISQEIVLSELLNKMMRIVLENAGAERGCFLMAVEDKWYIEAEGEAAADNFNVLHSVWVEDVYQQAEKMPASAIVNFVMRTKKSLVLDDASSDASFADDNYIRHARPKSILCTPIINKGKISGILYLENNLSIGAFTPDRVEILKMLSAELGISIENANLYKNLEGKVAERTRELHVINQELLTRNQEIQNSQALIEEINHHITNSIKYAERIQKAVLPPASRLTQTFADYFAIFKPKDIVSGDFYWFSEIDGKVFVAVADCTGHGVPGAFLSMIGNTLLNKLINENRVFDPALVLEKLHIEMNTALRQGSRNKNATLQRDQRDGMDICLCQIDKQENRAIFSGAKRPLYLCRNHANGTLLEIKGDRRSIGGRHKKEGYRRTSHVIEFEKGDMIYLTSDGFADQQDCNNEKFGLQRLEAILSRIAGKPADQQKNILEEELRQHRGTEKQRDDITIIGFRL